MTKMSALELVSQSDFYQRRKAGQVRSGGRRESRAPVVDFAGRPILRFRQEMHHHVNTTKVARCECRTNVFASLALSRAIGHHHHYHYWRKSRNRLSATASR